MGALFGAHLAEAGSDPLLVDVDPAVVERHPRPRRDAASRTPKSGMSRSRATTDPAGEPPVDVLAALRQVLRDGAALELAAPLIGDDTLVLSLQNGWGNADRVAAVVPRERVFAGVTYHSATLLAPGVVDHTAVGTTYLGPHHGGRDGRRGADPRRAGGAGLEAEVTRRSSS